MDTPNRDEEPSTSLSPRKKFTKFRNTITSTTKEQTSKRKGLLGRKKISSQALVVNSQLDLSQNPIKLQREFQLHEISDIKCFEGDILKSIKKSFQQTSKAVTFFNTRYYKGKQQLHTIL